MKRLRRSSTHGPQGVGGSADQRDLPPDFWAPRQSFRKPIPELEIVAQLLDQAADAFIAGQLDVAKDLIIQADMPVVGAYGKTMVGPISREVHRYRRVPRPPRPAVLAAQRMPGARVAREIFERDGWRCRFCEVRVVAKNAIKTLHKAFPAEARWGSTAGSNHHGLSTLYSSLDHVLPHSAGGANDPENLVTACGPCQFGRGNWTLEEVGILDPRKRPPLVDSWDGLMRICRAPFRQFPRPVEQLP